MIENNDVAIWSTPLNGGEEGSLTGIPKFNAAESWTATAHGIYYTSSSSRPPAVNFYDFATSSAKRLLTLPRPPTPGGGASVSPDGRWLLYTNTDDAQSDIMVAEHFR